MESKTLVVNEVFYSLQGEGLHVGRPSIFVRLSGCNMDCSFCDTTHKQPHEEWTLKEILLMCQTLQHDCKHIIWTGGEPTLQLTSEVVQWFKDKGYHNSIETNGSNPVPCNMDYVAVSPKVPNKELQRNFHSVDELRYPMHATSSLPEPSITADHYYLSPIFDFNNKVNADAFANCIELCRQNPQWKLSVQAHKLWRIR